MKILLDTCVVLRAQQLDYRLSDKAKEIISDMNNEIYYSVISAWEVQIKHDKFPVDFMTDGTTFINDCEAMGYVKIGIEKKHLEELGKLKNIHKDPFDRLMLAQAKSEDMYFMTEDGIIKQYGYEKTIVLN